jgi:hypothetical protein
MKVSHIIVAVLVIHFSGAAAQLAPTCYVKEDLIRCKSDALVWNPTTLHWGITKIACPAAGWPFDNSQDTYGCTCTDNAYYDGASCVCYDGFPKTWSTDQDGGPDVWRCGEGHYHEHSNHTVDLAHIHEVTPCTGKWSDFSPCSQTCVPLDSLDQYNYADSVNATGEAALQSREYEILTAPMDVIYDELNTNFGKCEITVHNESYPNGKPMWVTKATATAVDWQVCRDVEPCECTCTHGNAYQNTQGNIQCGFETSLCLLNECNKGYNNSQNNLECVPCPAGTFQDDVSDTVCRPCQAGSTCAGGEADPVPCGTGQYSAPKATTCTNCAAGTNDDDSNPATPCKGCVAGQYSAPKATSCDDCAAGTNDDDSNPATPCKGCVAGQYSAPKATTCDDCAAGTNDDDSNPATPCKGCVAGQYSAPKATTCTNCAAGTNDDDSNPATPCKGCVAGQYSATGATSCDDCVAGTNDDDLNPATACVNCVAGKYSFLTKATSCTDCAVGTFQNDTGQPSCKVCPTNSSSNHALTNNATNCNTCLPGRGSIKKCIAGLCDGEWKYQHFTDDGVLHLVCEECPTYPTPTLSAVNNWDQCVPDTTCAPGFGVKTGHSNNTVNSSALCLACSNKAYNQGEHGPCHDVPADAAFERASPREVRCRYNDGKLSASWWGILNSSSYDLNNWGEYESGCHARSTCSAGDYVISEGNHTHDRKCGTCSAGYKTLFPNEPQCYRFGGVTGYEWEDPGDTTLVIHGDSDWKTDENGHVKCLAATQCPSSVGFQYRDIFCGRYYDNSTYRNEGHMTINVTNVALLSTVKFEYVPPVDAVKSGTDDTIPIDDPEKCGKPAAGLEVSTPCRVHCNAHVSNWPDGTNTTNDHYHKIHHGYAAGQSSHIESSCQAKFVAGDCSNDVLVETFTEVDGSYNSSDLDAFDCEEVYKGPTWFQLGYNQSFPCLSNDGAGRFWNLTSTSPVPPGAWVLDPALSDLETALQDKPVVFDTTVIEGIDTFFNSAITALDGALLQEGFNEATVAREKFYESFNYILLMEGQLEELEEKEGEVDDAVGLLVLLNELLWTKYTQLESYVNGIDSAYHYEDCAIGHECLGGDSPQMACASGSVQPGSGQAGCTACAAGTYDDGTEICMGCGVGTYQPATGKSECIGAAANQQIVVDGGLRVGQKACGNGTYRNETAASDTCTDCGSGRSAVGGYDCRDCTAGYFSGEPAVSQCKICPDGSATDRAGSDCDLCTLTGASTCTPCGAGRFSTVSSIACADCPEGFFQEYGSETECVRPVQASIRVCEGRTDTCRNATVAYNGTYTTTEKEHAVEDSTGGSHVPAAGSTAPTPNSDCVSAHVETTVPSASADRVCGDGRPTQSVTIHYSEIIV